MRNLTKHQLIQEIAIETGYTQATIKTVVEQFLELISEFLLDEKNIEFRGFGTFNVKTRKPRPARNPRTGEVVYLHSRIIPSLKFSNTIKKQMTAQWEAVSQQAYVDANPSVQN